MSFDKTQIEALRESGAIFRAAPEAVAARFYLLLFEANPELRRLFPDNLDDQGRKLAATLALVVDAIGEWQNLAPVLASLSRRHVGYGVEASHYGVVCTALIQTLTQTGATADQIASWKAALEKIASFMVSVAYPDRSVESH